MSAWWCCRHCRYKCGITSTMPALQRQAGGTRGVPAGQGAHSAVRPCRPGARFLLHTKAAHQQLQFCHQFKALAAKDHIPSHARGTGRSTTWEGTHGLHNIITAYVVGRRCCRTLCNGLMGRANREFGLHGGNNGRTLLKLPLESSQRYGDIIAL